MSKNEYNEKHIHFIDFYIPEMLKTLIKKLDKQYSLIDLGCGDGRILYVLYSNELKNASRIVGVGISKERIRRLKDSCPFAEGIVAGVCDLKQIPDNSFDVTISSQVVKHVPDDSKCLKRFQESSNQLVIFTSQLLSKCGIIFGYNLIEIIGNVNKL